MRIAMNIFVQILGRTARRTPTSPRTLIGPMSPISPISPIRFFGAVTPYVTPKNQHLTHCNAQ
jgi:hypothetical protein